MDILFLICSHTKFGVFGIFIILCSRLINGKARVKAVNKYFVAYINIGNRCGISGGSRIS